jgi:hypothetical protein
MYVTLHLHVITQIRPEIPGALTVLIQNTADGSDSSIILTASSAGRALWVESHSDTVVTGCWACEASRTANCLRTHLPAVFAV